MEALDKFIFAVFGIAIAGILLTWGLYAFVAVSAVKTVDSYCSGKSIAQCLGKASKEFNDEASK